MNIKFTYMYRCAGNFKNFNEVIFRNPGKIPLARLQQQLQEALLDSAWFFAHHVSVPELFFDEDEFDDELDHDRHEFVSIEEVKATATDAKNRTILQFVNAVQFSVFRFNSLRRFENYYPLLVECRIRRAIAGCKV